ncbi:phosphatidate cytidylyltransferase [Lactobacillaceae bacterium L1_55_11]|nr:phosphatidate cytidylyltransferase [Lactobacillaceae bacterium L1_55_11]
MKTRIITAVVALAIFIPLLIIGHWPLLILTLILGVVAMSEILRMSTHSFMISPEALISFAGVIAIILPRDIWQNIHLPFYVNSANIFYALTFLLLLRTIYSRRQFNYDDAGILVISIVYIGTGFHYFYAAAAHSLATVFFGLLIVWITDSGAYLVGRKLGKNKLAPKISPNKTWEGSVGGTLVAVLVVPAIYALNGWSHYSYWTLLVVALILSIGGQFGDLIESAFKRYFRVKDSGTILPGHGGILDRFDSMLVVMPLMSILGML